MGKGGRKWSEVSKHRSRAFRSLIGVLFLYIAGPQGATAEPALRVSGHYEELSYSGGEPDTNRVLRVVFAATLSGDAWQIGATNRDNPAEWETLTYDGTNSYALMPYEGRFDKSRNSALFGVVKPGNHYNPPIISRINMVYPWLAFGLRPQETVSDMSLPWKPSNWMTAYGYRWTIESSPDERFISVFTVVRDTSLDLDEKGELARLSHYPATIKDLTADRESLAWRRNVPDGFVDATYGVTEWLEVAGQKVPKVVGMQRNTLTWDGKPIRILDLTLVVNRASPTHDAIEAPSLSEVTYVRDYRYRRKDSLRLFRFAEYTGKGEWKTDKDPELLAHAQSYMRHGPRMGDYGFWTKLYHARIETRRLVVWTVLILAQLGIAAGLIYKLMRRKAQK